MRFLSLIFLVLLSSPAFGLSASGIWLSDEFVVSKTGSISVKLHDDAVDGCWTNLRETREYAEEKLRAKGGRVVSNESEYKLNISVVAYRIAGGCVGSILIELDRPKFIENKSGDMIYHLAVVGSANWVFSGYNKANNSVLNYTKKFLDLLK